MKIIFYNKDRKKVKDQGSYCLTSDGEIACWDDGQGWTTYYCEGMSYKIEETIDGEFDLIHLQRETIGLSDEQIDKLKENSEFKHNEEMKAKDFVDVIRKSNLHGYKFTDKDKTK